ASVTIVMIGRCTWARRYVGWEIQSSLRQGLTVPPPNGLLGIVLPSAGQTPVPPSRLQANIESGYAQWYWYPQDAGSLSNMIETAFQARTRTHQIVNPRDRFYNNRMCW